MATQHDASLHAPQTCGDLLSLAVHELRSPLSVVNGYVRMFRQDGTSPRTEREAKMLREAEAVCGRIAAILTEMSDLAKLDAGTAPMKHDAFDLFAVVREAATTVHEGSDRGVMLEPRGAASGALLRGDVDRMRVAIAALLQSALREQIAAGTVVADCRLETTGGIPSGLVVIAEEQLAGTAMSGTPAPFNEQRGGLGLLLPIARRIVQYHGGLIWTTGLRGATIVSLPLHK